MGGPVLDLPVERIQAVARQARPGQGVVTVLLAVFYALGWLAGAAVNALAWAWAGVRVGWQDARKNATATTRQAG